MTNDKNVVRNAVPRAAPQRNIKTWRGRGGMIRGNFLPVVWGWFDTQSHIEQVSGLPYRGSHTGCPLGGNATSGDPDAVAGSAYLRNGIPKEEGNVSERGCGQFSIMRRGEGSSVQRTCFYWTKKVENISSVPTSVLSLVNCWSNFDCPTLTRIV